MATDGSTLQTPPAPRWSPVLGTYVDEAGRPLRPTKRPWHIPLGLRAMSFLIVFSVLHFSWEASRGGVIEWTVIHDWTVSPAVWLLNKLTPMVHATAVQFSIRAPRGGLNILNGCEGTEALFLLVAALLVAPLGLRAKTLGVLVGIPLVFIINQARIDALFYAYESNRALFDQLHSIVAPLSVILIVCAYFYACLVYARR